MSLVQLKKVNPIHNVHKEKAIYLPIVIRRWSTECRQRHSDLEFSCRCDGNAADSPYSHNLNG